MKEIYAYSLRHGPLDSRRVTVTISVQPEHLGPLVAEAAESTTGEATALDGGIVVRVVTLDEPPAGPPPDPLASPIPKGTVANRD